MKMTDATIGQEVVRAKGDYVVGRVGNILAIDAEKNRAQVSWGSWVSFTAIEPTSIPYIIIRGCKENNFAYPKYKRN